MQTARLYHDDPRALAFSANIIEVRDDAVALNRTAFYPEAGGQPCDTGFLVCGDARLRVTGVWADPTGQIVWHRVESPTVDVTPGQAVCGEVDPVVRRLHSAHHTALHVLNGLVFRDFGARVTGAQIHPERSRMDFELESAGSEMRNVLQDALDTEVRRAATVRIYWMTREDFLSDGTLVRTVGRSVPAAARVRIVEVDGLDRQACGGTHLESVGELARIVVLTFKSKGRNNKRAEVAVELR